MKDKYKYVYADPNDGTVVFRWRAYSSPTSDRLDITPFLPLTQQSEAALLMVYPEIQNFIDIMHGAIKFWEGCQLLSNDSFYAVMPKGDGSYRLV